MAGRIPLIIGNWKMNGLSPSLAEARQVREGLAGALGGRRVRLMICPPATLLAPLADLARGSALEVGGQDCHAAASGAHTGDVSAEMLRDAGATAVIVGHSERRSDHGERDADVRAKAVAAARAGLTPIVCIGETAGERQAGLTLAVLARQLAGSLPDGIEAKALIVAYEPVWAIGTGLTPSAADVAGVHRFLRGELQARLGDAALTVPLLYGGSVKPSNAAELLTLPDVDGGLIGGASLKAVDFLAIAAAVAG